MRTDRRLPARLYDASCWRSARFSSTSASRRMNRLRRKPRSRAIRTFYSSRKPQRFQPGRGFRGVRGFPERVEDLAVVVSFVRHASDLLSWFLPLSIWTQYSGRDHLRVAGCFGDSPTLLRSVRLLVLPDAQDGCRDGSREGRPRGGLPVSRGVIARCRT